MNAPQKKEKLVRVTTPAGFLSYPKLDKPGETKFDLGFYHADLFISAEDMGSDDGIPVSILLKNLQSSLM
jgi:hypothetical protein